jgi:hypothetical protein
MTSIREAIRRGLSGRKPTPSASQLSYAAHWVGVTGNWTLDRQRELLRQVQGLMESPEFSPTAFERRYVLAGLDEIPHAGASLTALRGVLEARLEGS